MTTWLKTDTFKRGYLVLWIALALSTPTLAATEAGPFQSQEDAALYSSQLEQPFSTAERVEQKPAEYIIVSDAVGPELGQNLLEDLTRENIGDVVYVRTGEFGGRVSAGVYLRQGPSARRRIKMLRDEGFQFKPLPRKMQDVSQYWVSSEGSLPDNILATIKQSLGYELTFVTNAAEIETELSQFAEVEAPIETLVETPVETPVKETILTEVSESSEIETTDSESLNKPLSEAIKAFDVTSEKELSGNFDVQEDGLVNPSFTEAETETETETIVGIDTEVDDLKELTSPVFSKQAPNPQSQPWLLYIGILLAVAVLIGVISFLIRRTNRTLPEQPEAQESTQKSKAPTANSVVEEDTRPANPELAISQPDPIAPALPEIETETETETTKLRGKDSLDLISDQVILAQNEKSIKSHGTFDLAVLLLAAVNEARSLHHISPIKYRPISMLPHVFSDAQAIQRMLSIIIQQTVSFDDAAHVLIQAEYKAGQLTISCLNESALVNETELQQLTVADSQASLRLKTAEILATRMQGHMTFASKFGTGTNITLAVELPLAQEQVMLKESDIIGIAESRMRLIKSREVTVPAANAGLEALEAMLSPAASDSIEDLNKTEKLTTAITAMNKQLKTVELAEQQAVIILETVINLAHQNHKDTDEAARKTLAQVAQIATELNHAKPKEQTESTPRAFPPYGSTDSSHEFFTQLKAQVEEIETARAQGDLQSLSRVARWTAKYADGLGMILVATQFRTIGEAIRKGDELRMLEALTTIHMGLARLNTEGIEASKLA